MLQQLITVIFMLHSMVTRTFSKKIKIYLDYYEVFVDLRNNRN
jgi:hypothetical protein